MGISKWNAGIIRPVPVAPTGPYATSAAPGVWTLDQQAYWQKQGLWPTAGSVDPSAFIENLFSTYLYTGNGTTQTITNGVNLSGKGGLVWSKSRSSALSHVLVDTVRGSGLNLSSDTTAAQSNPVLSVTSFLADGYTLGSRTGSNDSGVSFASWTFREQPKFFDIVTYTADSVNGRAISHNLGSVPGMVIFKSTTNTSQWYIWHNALNPTTEEIYFNTSAKSVGGLFTQAPTSTELYLKSGNVNFSGLGTFVVYLFAHNAGGFGLTGTDNVISCGSYTGNGSTTNGPLINLGYEPQWLLIKNASAVYDWFLYDTMRGLTADLSTSTNPVLYPNLSAAQADFADIAINSTGFKIKNAAANPRINASGNTYIYIAVRRGPMKVPTLGTSVFSVDTTTAGSAITSTLKQTDMGWFKDRTTIANWFVADRLRGFTNAYYTPTLYTNLTNAEATPTTGDTVTAFGPTTTGVNNGVIYAGGAGVAGNYPLLYSFKRAPGFFDEVCYTGTGVARTVAHNLTVVPELMIVKNRVNARNWRVYVAPLGAASSLNLNTDAADGGLGVALWNSTAPTASVFSLGTDSSVNASADTYVAYLFATAAGVSKVGSYIGTGALQTVACGFTGGARFVLVKATSTTGDWYVWDSARGITSGNDPYLLLNSTAAEVTVNNYVDTDTTGFKVTAAAPAALNAVGGTYIFLAIA